MKLKILLFSFLIASASLTNAQSDIFENTKPEVTEEDLGLYVKFLSSPALEGRLTGSEGEAAAAAFASQFFTHINAKPFSNSPTFLEKFSFNAGSSLGNDNSLSIFKNNENENHTVSADWLPLGLSQSGEFANEAIVFVGYGIVAPGTEKFPVYNSYAGFDVKNKWVLFFRFLPEDISIENKQYLNQFASLHKKVMVARDNGAKGVIVVSGPNSNVSNQLISLKQESSASMSIFGISVLDSVAERLFDSQEFLKIYQDKLDKGEMVTPFVLTNTISGKVDLRQETKEGKNIIAVLEDQKKNQSDQFILLTAHIDHLGKKVDQNGNEEIYFGADDNASGSAALMEIAQYLSAKKLVGKLNLNKKIVFALWSGEELGLLGSTNFANKFEKENGSVYPKIAAVINMDMVGRLRENLIFQGVGSSSVWSSEIDRLAVGSGLEILKQKDPYLPTDSTAFYIKGVPILNTFTGTHEDYHTPKDTFDKINYSGVKAIANFVSNLVEAIAAREDAPDYIKVNPPNSGGGQNKVYLGTIPDFSNTEVKGVLLAGVRPGSPAEKATLQKGDIIVSLAGQKIENLYDYQAVMSILKIGVEASIEVMRGETKIALKITPEAKP